MIKSKLDRIQRSPKLPYASVVAVVIMFSLGAVLLNQSKPTLASSSHTLTPAKTHKAATASTQASKPVDTPAVTTQPAAPVTPTTITTVTPKAQAKTTTTTTATTSSRTATVIGPTVTPPTTDSPYGPRCGALLSQYYTAYQADLKTMNAQHQANLNELKQAYDSGEYGSSQSAEAYNDYQADIQDENTRWNQQTASSQQSYNDKLRAAGCAYSI